MILKGIDRRKIFFDDPDREDFLDRLGAILADSKTACFAWAFMINHLHLLLRTGAASIATLLNLFGGKLPEARKLYLEFVKKRGCGGTPARFNGRRVGAKRRRRVCIKNDAQRREHDEGR
jgi:hypothetical protein